MQIRPVSHCFTGHLGNPVAAPRLIAGCHARHAWLLLTIDSRRTEPRAPKNVAEPIDGLSASLFAFRFPVPCTIVVRMRLAETSLARRARLHLSLAAASHATDHAWSNPCRAPLSVTNLALAAYCPSARPASRMRRAPLALHAQAIQLLVVVAISIGASFFVRLFASATAFLIISAKPPPRSCRLWLRRWPFLPRLSPRLRSLGDGDCLTT